MRIDWYQGTVVDDRVGGPFGERLTDALGSSLAAADSSHGHGRWGYAQEDTLRDAEGTVLARVLHGGRQGWPSVQGSGAAAPLVAEVLRAEWSHWVTRADVADDRAGEGAWEALYGPLLALADRRHLAVSQAGDWHRGEAGRTLYVGSRSSTVFLRLYEKGKQLLGLGQEADETACRVELVVRPTKLVRREAAAWSPEQMWGAAEWSKEAAALLAGLEVERVPMHEWRPGDDERALRALVRQYGGTLARLRTRLGSDAAVGEWLLARVS